MKNQKSIDQESLELYSKEYFIVISENGFIHIGRPKPINCPIMGDIIRVFDCYTIRRWGTSNGIGELCIKGKQESTILDYNGITDIQKNKVLQLLHIKETALESYGFTK